MEKNKNKKPAQRPRKKKRRLRKDRVTLVATILVAFLVLIICFISRCSDNGTVRAGDFSVPIPEAIEAGRRDAQVVERTAPGTMDRQRALFDIHVRESRLRNAGYIHAADQYIGAAREYISTHNLDK